MERKLGARLREVRIEAGYSIQALSRLTGINASSLCRWENNKQDITGDMLIIISKALKVSADYLLGLID